MRSFSALVFVVAYALCFFVDWYIYKRRKSLLKKARSKRRWNWISLANSLLTVGLLTVLLIWPKRNPEVSLYPVLWVAYIFIGFIGSKLVYVLMDLLGGGVALLFGRFVSKKRIRSIFSWIGIIGGALLIIEMIIGVVYTRNQIETHYVDIVSDRLPQGFEGYKVVQISDLHLGTWGDDTSFVSELVDSINALKPDMILFTGDLVSKTTEEMRPFKTELSRLRARDGVWSVLGNHDYGVYADWGDDEQKKRNLDLLKEWQKEIGWRMLNNDHSVIRHEADSIMLIGVENWGLPPFKQNGDLSKADIVDGVNRLKDGSFKILMTHNPDHWRKEVLNISNIDLTVSGHTHAMQMIFPLIGSPSSKLYPEWRGLYTDSTGRSNRYLYVNIGSGNVGYPARFGSAYPEITVFNLKRIAK